MSDARGLEAEQLEIRRLVEAYAGAMDRTDIPAFSRLFVSDGSLIVRARGRKKPLGVFEGPSGVGLIARLLGELYVATLHNITTHQVVMDGDAATGTTYCLAYHIVGGENNPTLETLGVRYEDEYVRTGDGWRMRVRDAMRLWSQITPIDHEPLLIDRAAAQSRAPV